jgi:hypothetical protein
MPNPPQTDPDVIDQFTQAVSSTAGFMTNVLKYAGMLGVPDVISGIMKMFVPGKPDPTAVALQAIQAKLDTVLHFAVAHDEKEHMFHVNDVIHAAATDWRTLGEVNCDFNSSLVNISDFNAHTSDAANSLMNSNLYWLRPFWDGLVYTDGWIQGTQPEIDTSLGPDLPQVWDYRLTLPSFLYAIQIRCGFKTALHKIKPSVETDAIFQRFKDLEVKPMLAFLSDAYQKLLNGFVSPAVPTLDQMRQWQIASSKLGAVQIYGGYTAMEQFFDGPPFHPTDLEFSAFAVRFRLNNMARRVAGYQKLALGKVWESIQSLNSFLGQPAEGTDLHAGWSVRAIDSSLAPDFRGATVFISVRSLIHRMRTVKNNGHPNPPPSPLSFRDSLNAIIVA